MAEADDVIITEYDSEKKNRHLRMRRLKKADVILEEICDDSAGIEKLKELQK